MKIIIFVFLFCITIYPQWNIGELITEYEEECYNDSSFQKIHTTPPANSGNYCIIDWDCTVSSHWSNKWIHREPTWDGFRDFIKRKYKKMVKQ